MGTGDAPASPAEAPVATESPLATTDPAAEAQAWIAAWRQAQIAAAPVPAQEPELIEEQADPIPEENPAVAASGNAAGVAEARAWIATWREKQVEKERVWPVAMSRN
jgi:hypothetical protein